MSDKHIVFTPASAKLFVKAYNKAKRENTESFFFNEDEFVVGYAYYMIQYFVMNKTITGVFDNNKIFTYDN